jgi:hypothetical protein
MEQNFEKHVKKFQDYWEEFGELHASFCNGDIKQFAKEIWMSAFSSAEETIRETEVKE